MKKIVIIGASLLVGSAALAQNLNPTVEVTNTYAREASGIEKPSQLMQLPDSVYHFNLDFNYEVYSTPYQGAYEFKPYLVQLRPQARPVREGDLYVRAGAGFTFHPELEAVWTPFRRDNFRLNLFAEHNSYFGDYKSIYASGGVLDHDGDFWKGSQMRTRLGADALFGWAGGTLQASVSYKNIGSTAEDDKYYHHYFLADARVKSNPSADIVYEAGTRISLMGGFLEETHTVSDAMLGTVFGYNRISLGVGLETLSQAQRSYVGNVSLAPHYIFDIDRFHLDAGVKFAITFRGEDDFYPHKGGFFFPDAHVSYNAVQDVFTLYAQATGGPRINAWSTLLESNPFLPLYAGNLDTSIERLNLALGMRGNVAERFHYDVKAGYAWWQNALLYGYDFGVPVLGYEEYLHQLFADAALGWKSDALDLSSRVLFRKTNVDERELLAPPVLSAYVTAVYNWGDRIHAGVSLDVATESAGEDYSVPGWVSPGIYADLQMTPRLGFWLSANNLTGATIQRVPMIAQRGAWVTLGVTYKL